jgi:phosphoribosylformimino-5-aminoimidazole carboxamide ribotide isomerase
VSADATPFVVYPAVDLKGGRCVRLLQGRADAVTDYGDDPVAMARRWEAEGAQWLHVVDLDGAFAGRAKQADLVGRMAAAIRIPVQTGGGIRTDDDIQRLLDAGVARVVIGTRALERPDELPRLAEKFGGRLAVGIDARDGLVQIRGWTETTAVRAVDLASRCGEAGIRTIIVTDTATDGMLEGPNLPGLADVCDASACHVIASGGVSSAGDIAALRGLRRDNLAGVIVGKALYEGRVRLADVLG